MTQGNLVVAIDGPSGSGKSTVARQVAMALRLRYLDTGAMYRAVTWLALRAGIAPADTAALAELAGGAVLELGCDPRRPSVSADGVDVTSAVRSPEVTAAVSAVSAVPEVRRAMVRRQRELIGDGGIVVEGRDIGTTVAPDAPVKVFLTADPAIRARRRSQQEGRDGKQVAATEADLARRDTADATRKASPLAQPPDALVVDSTALGVDEVVRRVLDRANTVTVG